MNCANLVTPARCGLPSIIVAAMALLALLPTPARADDVLVFAAASLKPALDEILSTPAVKAAGPINASYAASSQLARQIEHGAPSALFISADQDWMDHLDARGLVDRRSRADLIGNTLVLIAPADSALSIDLAPTADLAGALGDDGRLAIGEPNSVPAGKYAKTALTALGVWASVEARTVAATNVRAALAFVARKEAALGIVYHSDAVSEPAVRILDTFPADSHPTIVYPVAIVAANDSPAARALLAALRSTDARAILLRHGFTLPPTSPSTRGVRD